jgi:hypothetical protein
MQSIYHKIRPFLLSVVTIIQSLFIGDQSVFQETALLHWCEQTKSWEPFERAPQFYSSRASLQNVAQAHPRGNSLSKYSAPDPSASVSLIPKGAIGSVE